MKKLLVLAGIIAMLLAWNYGYAGENPAKVLEAIKELVAEEQTKIQCVTGIKDQDKCLMCHTTPSFKLKETNKNEGLDIPTDCDILYDADGSKYGRYFLTGINSNAFKKGIDYFMKHGVTRMIIEIQSPGGSLFDAWRIVGMMQAWMDNGKRTIETHCYGFAMSAGFLIFASGSKGKRMVSPTAEFMWHELLTFEMFAIKTPSSTEEQSRVLRHLQDTGNSWLASVSNMTKEDLDAKVKSKELWLRGTEMVEQGFADGFLDK